MGCQRVEGGSGMRCRTGWLLVAALICVGISGCGSESPEDDPALAKVGSKVIRESDLDGRLEIMSAMARAEYEGGEGRKTLLRKMIEEETFYQAAEAAGYAKNEAVLAEVERVRRNAMLRTYYEQEVVEKAKPGREEVETYYRDHLDEFRVNPRVRIRHVLTETEAEAGRVRDLAVMGRDFENLAATYSVDDRTKDRGGLIPGYLVTGKQVPLFGNVPELVEAAVALEAGEIGPVVRSHLGYHVIRAEEVHPGGLLPLDEVRDDIERRETERRVGDAYNVKLIELKERLGVEVLGENAEPPTVEELFEQAQQAGTPRERIQLYQKVLSMYPGDERAYEAQFMIGFTYSEEMGDYDRARPAFESVVNNYPGCDLYDSAEWMLENMGEKDLPMEEINRALGRGEASEG